MAFRPTLEYKEMRGREKWYLRSSYSLIVFSGKQKTKCKLVKIEFHHSVLHDGDSECSFGDMDFSSFGMNWCLKRKFLTFCKIAQFTARSCFVYNIYFLRKWVCSKRFGRHWVSECKSIYIFVSSRFVFYNFKGHLITNRVCVFEKDRNTLFVLFGH